MTYDVFWFLGLEVEFDIEQAQVDVVKQNEKNQKNNDKMIKKKKMSENIKNNNRELQDRAINVCLLGGFPIRVKIVNN